MRSGEQAIMQREIVMLTPDRQIDRRILLQADSLEAVGWKVTIIAMPLDEVRADDDRRVVRLGSNSLKATPENIVLDCYRWLRRRLSMNGIVMRWLKRIAWQYFVDQESFYIRLFYGTVSTYSPTIFVANDLPMLPVAKIVAEKCGSSLVYDSHELYSEQEFSEREKKRWAEIEAKYIGACDAVMTVNESIADELKRRYDLSKVEVISNAERSRDIPVKSTYFHDFFGVKRDKKVLLLQGGMSSGRNLDVLVDSMRYVENDKIILIFLGDGLFVKTLQKKTQAAKLDRKIYFHPAVEQKKLSEITNAADAGIIPYQSTCMNNLYCTPNKLFEFISSGIPIIATHLPEIKKIVDLHEIGMTGDTRTPSKLASLIDDFFSDQQRFANWKANLLTVRKVICWEEEEKKLVRIFETFR